MTKFTPSQVRGTEAQDEVLAPRRTGSIGKYALGAIALAAIVGAGVFISGWTRAERSVNAERLRFATVERGDFVRDTAVSGFVVAANSPMLYSPAAGIVSLRVRAGDPVEQGAILAVVDSPELTNRGEQEAAALVAAETELSRLRISTRQRALAQRKNFDDAKVALTAADREKRRAEQAFEKNAISRIDLEKARDDYERARLEFNHASEEQTLLADALKFEVETQQATVARQRLQLSDLQRQVQGLEIRSPVKGMVGNVAIEQRAAVAANQALLTVVDLTAYEVEARIPETYADSLALGMGAEIDYARAKYPAVIAGVSPEVENGQVAVRIRFGGETPSGLRQNQRVAARMIFEQKDDTLYVRRGPFFESGGGRIAYVVEDGDIARRQNIVAGAQSVDKIEILDGLNAGDRIVISNTDAFRDAAQVFLNR